MKQRNHEVTTRQPLLNGQGNIAEPGWSRRMVQEYHRKDIKAPKIRIKEWDYYCVMGDDFGVAFTLSDEGYAGLQSVSFLDFVHMTEHTESITDPFPMGRMHLPEHPDEADIIYDKGRLTLKYLLEPDCRHIICHFRKFHGDKDFSCDIRLERRDTDSMVIATPWDKQHHFYYNQKTNCMRADGWVKYGEEEHRLYPDRNFGTLDWGRGVWTYDNIWVWGSGNCDVDGKAFGFNLGYGFGNTSAATENILFYEGKAHKLDDVHIDMTRKDENGCWKITSSDGRFEGNFEPLLDRAAVINLLIINSDQHQYFGRLNASAILDDGTKIEIKDLMCFFENIHNKY